MDLVMMTSLYPEVRVVKKATKPKSTSLDIFKVDLMTDEEKEAAAKNSKKKGVKTDEIPWKVFLGHEMADHDYTELVILVPEVVAKGGKEETAK